MKVIYDINEFPETDGCVVTTGTFDGVHVGHRKIITRLKEVANIKDKKSVIITFWPHPRLVLFPDDNSLKLLNSIQERVQLIDREGIDYLLVINFTVEFSRLTSEEFIKKILVEKLNTKSLVIGYDHRFGKNREGSFQFLKENSGVFGFDVQEISAEDIDNVTVSSTKIRNAIIDGNIKLANEYLGYNYFLKGIVVEGNQLGRKLGFPTANIGKLDKHKLIPADGVYAVTFKIGIEIFFGMLNIGFKPTVSSESKKTIEVHIFEFDDSIYGKEVEVAFLEKIRDEKKFENEEELVKQLNMDKNYVLNLIS
jgi:riboflavin kinase / FMN adenylyltransferase